ncbi:hypothetical protein [Luteitalea sp. TBR-22]|uniref:hypothetical protein n=1 Tax=Luteitalea sp. TBR-22 TaxID=2802971 RepID=UPI001EF6DCDB|nr:hypothetical protein [Luteitalea sp. TBR-22]
MRRKKPAESAVAAVAAVSLLLDPSMLIVAAAQSPPTPTRSTAVAAGAQGAGQRPPTGAAAATRPPGTGAADATSIDGGWPRTYPLASGGSIVVYQPQIASWRDQRQMVAYSAVAYRASAQATGKPVLGTIRLEARTRASVSDRLVKFDPIDIAEANFQTLPREQVRDLTAAIEKAIPNDERVIALDRVLAYIDKSQVVPRNVEGLKADPPTIFFSTTPAVVVNLDGDPIWSPIKDNDLKYVVNTNWDLFQHTPTKTLYLRNDDAWLTSTDIKGPWLPAGTLPSSFGKLPADQNWAQVKAALPGRKLTAAPKVFLATTPGELILLTGAPRYVAVPGASQLLWVSNTESDVFRVGKAGTVYYLVAGRWFSAPDFSGPWSFATPSLPEDFKKIPLEHERSRVLASVPGTDQAAEAVLLASVPETARVNKKTLVAPEVTYNGDAAQFAPIEKTTVTRAVNTDKDVFKVGDAYYMCYQGVWFVGKTATGPWQVAESVPEAIYQIPASSPAHHVTYVTVEDDDDDDWVVFAAAAGYTGMMVAWGCAVWGTGWYYPPYWGYGGMYPYYYPHFPTYGYSAWYNPWTGAYGRSAAVYGPYGGAGVGARYNPRTGTYARGAAAYGPYGARGVAHAYNPRTGTYAGTRQGSNVYGSWGSTAVQRGDDWAATQRYTNRRTGTTTRTIRTDDGAAITRRGDQGAVGVGSSGDVYAGRDGNVYRRQDGTWQKYDNGDWSNTDRQPGPRPDQQPRTTRPETSPSPAPADRATTSQLDRDARARAEGSQRTRDQGSYRSGGSSVPRSGSYGSYGGGMRRGGGGRRR